MQCGFAPIFCPKNLSQNGQKIHVQHTPSNKINYDKIAAQDELKYRVKINIAFKHLPNISIVSSYNIICI